MEPQLKTVAGFISSVMAQLLWVKFVIRQRPKSRHASVQSSGSSAFPLFFPGGMIHRLCDRVSHPCPEQVEVEWNATCK